MSDNPFELEPVFQAAPFSQRKDEQSRDLAVKEIEELYTAFKKVPGLAYGYRCSICDRKDHPVLFNVMTGQPRCILCLAIDKFKRNHSTKKETEDEERKNAERLPLRIFADEDPRQN